MTLMDEGLQYYRLRAPSEDGAILADPPLSAAASLVERNVELASGYDYDLHGRSLTDLAQQARHEMAQAAWRYTRQYRDAPQPGAAQRIFVAGHQPQLFHPGVWFKNFALSALAGSQSAVAINLVIDSDTIKTTVQRVPGGSARRPIVESVPLDRPTAEIPFEERPIVDRQLLEGFGERAYQIVRTLVPHPLIEQFWALVVERSRACNLLGECLAQARHQQEGLWGGQTLEVPQSSVCGLESFYWFTAHLLARLPRLWEVYNSAVADYRRVNHVRSVAHPVPDLAVDGRWLEAPFWIWDRVNPRRRRLFVTQRGEEIVLTDRQGWQHALRLSPEGEAGRAVEQLAELSRAGVKIRTRALLTTAFARLLLGDLFVHGIGGAKYDQVTDVIISRFFGLEPPDYMTVTATLRLPIDRTAAAPQDARQIDHRLRELTYHPERFLSGQLEDAGVRELVAWKQRWIATPPTPENARQRCQEIRHVNRELQPLLSQERQQLLARRESIAQALRSEAILSSREYAFCFYPADKLRSLMERARLEAR